MSKNYNDDDCVYPYGEYLDLIGNRKDGTLGNDSLSGNNALNDIINGFAGNDVLRGFAGDDFLHGGSGEDTLYGQDGNDLLVGGADFDYLSGGNGDDVLVGGQGLDHLRGGKGHDIFVVYEGDSVVGSKDLIKDFNVCEDVIQICEDKEFDFYDLNIKKIRSDKYEVSFDDFVIDVQLDKPGYLSAKNFVGHDGDCAHVYGEELLTGANFVQGTANADSLSGNALDNTINGFAGDDILRGNGGDDSVHGGKGNDTIYGNSGNDMLIGGCGDDYISGGDGDDVVVGALGADDIRGGKGNDTFAFYDGDSTVCGKDLIKDFNWDNDTIKIYSNKEIDFDDVQIKTIRSGKFEVSFFDFCIQVQTEYGDALTSSDFVFEQVA